MLGECSRVLPLHQRTRKTGMALGAQKLQMFSLCKGSLVLGWIGEVGADRARCFRRLEHSLSLKSCEVRSTRTPHHASCHQGDRSVASMVFASLWKCHHWNRVVSPDATIILVAFIPSLQGSLLVLRCTREHAELIIGKHRRLFGRRR